MGKGFGSCGACRVSKTPWGTKPFNLFWACCATPYLKTEWPCGVTSAPGCPPTPSMQAQAVQHTPTFCRVYAMTLLYRVGTRCDPSQAAASQPTPGCYRHLSAWRRSAARATHCARTRSACSINWRCSTSTTMARAHPWHGLSQGVASVHASDNGRLEHPWVDAS